MPGRSSYFYADENDLADLLVAFQESAGFKYVQMRSELNQPNEVYDDPLEILEEAMATCAEPIRRHSFLVIDDDQEIFCRHITLRDGSGVRSIADQNNNFNSIVIAFGGYVGNQTILMSDVNTVGDTDKAIEIHKVFKKIIMANTTRVGGKGRPYRLMPEALKKLKSGWHLTQNKVWKPGVEEIELSDEKLAKLG